MDDTLDPRPSPKVIALKDFSRYQINPEPKGSSSNQPRRKSFKSSIQELKFKRKVVFDAPGLETLPGVTEPLMANHDVSYADIEKTMKDDEGSLKNISFLGIGDQIKYWSLLLLFTICRGALYPALAMVPYSIVPKLKTYNQDQLSMMLAPLFLSEIKNNNGSLLTTYQEQKGVLLITSLSFSIWIFCAVYASHHNDIGQVIAISTCQFMFLSIYRLFKGTTVSNTERKGILVTLASLIVLLFWNSPSHTPHTYLDLGIYSYWEIFFYGNLLALIGSAASSIYVIYSRKLRTGNSLHFNNFNFTMFGLILYGLINVFFEGEIEELEHLQTHSSILDLFALHTLIRMVLIAFFTGLLPMVLYSYLSRVFEPAVMSAAFVFQPMAALALAILFDLQSFPSIIVFVGIIASIIGNYMVRKEVTSAGTDIIAIDDDQISVDNGQPNHSVASSKKHVDMDLILL